MRRPGGRTVFKRGPDRGLECLGRGASKAWGRMLRGKRAGQDPGPWRDSATCSSQFHPTSGPLRGSTRLTLCGSNFYLHPNGLVPEGTHRVTVGQSPCQLLRKDSSNIRYNPVPALCSWRGQPSVPFHSAGVRAAAGYRGSGCPVSRETSLSLLELTYALPLC